MIIGNQGRSGWPTGSPPRSPWCVATALVSAVVGAVVLAGCTSAEPVGAGPPPDGSLPSRLVEEVTGREAYPHLEELQRIADRNGGNRASPGPGYDASVDYVASVLRGAGYQVSTPTFTVDGSPVRNVIAQTRTGSQDQVVMAGAHLDSVPAGPGINDNGSGVASLLEIAVRLGGSPPVANAVRFAWWGAEENGLLGSTDYVDHLTDQDRDRIALYLNLDMVASPNPGYLVQGGKGDDSEAGPPGSEQVARVLLDQFAAAGVEADTIGSEGRGSDYAPFVEAHIPTGGVLSGDTQAKTIEQAQRWGGQAGADFDPCYHSACDRLNNVDPLALDRFTDAVAGTLAHFAVTTDTLPE